MILLTRGAGNPARVAHAVRILRPSPLEEVAAAIAEYASTGLGAVYVERTDAGYRWSPAHRGGAYPLMRVVARFLECAHTDIIVGFVTVDRWAIAADPDEPRAPSWAILEVPSTDLEAARDAIEEAIG